MDWLDKTMPAAEFMAEQWKLATRLEKIAQRRRPYISSWLESRARLARGLRVREGQAASPKYQAYLALRAASKAAIAERKLINKHLKGFTGSLPSGWAA